MFCWVFWGWDGDRNWIIPTGDWWRFLDIWTGPFAVCHDWQRSWFLGSVMKMPKPICFSLVSIPMFSLHGCSPFQKSTRLRFPCFVASIRWWFLGWHFFLSTIDLKASHSTKKCFDLWGYPQMWIGLFLWGKFSSQAIRAGVSIDHCIGCKGKPRGNHGA